MALNVQLNNGVTLSFPTPLLRYEIEDADKVNAALRKEILARAAKQLSTAGQNVGGWRSGDDLLAWPLKEIAVITKAINRAVAQLTQLTAGISGKHLRGNLNASAWATVCRPGDYVKPHIHPLSTWSGVYFVSGDEEVAGHPDSGVLEFLDPRSATGLLQTPGNPFGGTVKVKPKPGVLIVHPSWLAHFANPYRGAGERITIGFSAFVKGVAVAAESAES
jgi:uncharacterized protein (TIGR02466 family)